MDHFPRHCHGDDPTPSAKQMGQPHLQSRWDLMKPALQSRRGLLKTRSAKHIGLNGNWNKKVEIIK